MSGSPYRTPPFDSTPRLAPGRFDDSALPIVALVIVLVALAPPLTVVLSAWVGVHVAPDRIESTLEQRPSAPQP